MDVKEEIDLALSQEESMELSLQPAFKSHVLHCSYHYWHPRYRSITPKARLIPLTRPFVDYLRSDGIILPSDSSRRPQWSDSDSGVFSASDNTDARDSDAEDDDDDEEDEDVAADWRHVHDTIKDTIADLGGKVVPKLNWSSPKDATWMNANTLECRSPNDVYLLLKSSDFVTHDLEHAFDDCIDAPGSSIAVDDIPYHLVLRKYISKYSPSLEFRCFVRNGKLLCISQRDLQHYDFLADLQDRFSSLIKEFFEVRIHDSFPDPNYVFDVYIPSPYDRVWLIDFNPWALRTDPLLYSWREILEMPDPPEFTDSASDDDEEEETFVRVPFTITSTPSSSSQDPSNYTPSKPDQADSSSTPAIRSLSLSDPPSDDDLSDDEDDDDTSFDETFFLPELRLVQKHDPEARSFATPQYSAHKLPKDVVDASQADEGGLREFAKDWEDFVKRKENEK